MALIQIKEPNAVEKTNQQDKFALGIDLGTTNSLIAVVKEDKPTIVPDEVGNHLIPSVVYYGRDETKVGSKAYQQITKDPENTFLSIKRYLAKSLNDISTENTPYHYTGDNEQVLIKSTQGDKSPVAVSADILYALKKIAAQHLEKDINNAVITVPAYFSDAQRQATKDAAKIAGLNVLRLLNEPTAAAIAYGLDSQQSGVFVVYDLGGGTFDVSILHLNKGVFQVLATGGDSNLGGDDFDDLIIQDCQKQLSLKHLTSKEKQTLRKQAKQLKTALSEQNSAEIIWQKKRYCLDTDKFNQLIMPLLKRTLLVTKRALTDADIDTSDISEVIMVGGSTRIPLVREQLTALLKKKPLVGIDPDEVVALGAAIQADILIGNSQKDILLLDVLPLSLGIETMGGLVEKIIERNSTIPISKAQEFTTFKDGQTAMSIHILQGERELVSDCRSLANFTLKNIPAMVAGAARVRVSLQVDADGLLSVSAQELSSGNHIDVVVKPSYGLDEKQITEMLLAAKNNAKKDMEQRRINQQQVHAQRVLLAIDSALTNDGDLLSNKERQAIDEQIEKLQNICQTDQVTLIRTTIKQLETISEPFIARRMNQSVKKAMQGKSIKAFEL